MDIYNNVKYKKGGVMFKLENMEQVVSLAGLLHDFGKFTNRSSSYVKNIKNKEE